MLDCEVVYYVVFDVCLVEVVGGICLLGLISWLVMLQVLFLDSVVCGQLVLLKVDYFWFDFSEECCVLVVIVVDCDDSYLLGYYVWQLVQSWDLVVQLFEGLGIVVVDICLVQLFGVFEQLLLGNGLSMCDVVCYFIQIVVELDYELLVLEEQVLVLVIVL